MSAKRGKASAVLVRVDATEWGPAMQALNEKQRRFVLALYQVKPGHGAQVRAAKLAGYKCTTPESWAAFASRLIHDQKVQAALREHDQKVLRASAPRALRALQGLVEDPGHRDHARGIGMVLDRVHPVETRHFVRSEHEYVHRVVVDEETALRRIAEIAKRVGLDPRKIAPTIDAEFTAIENDGDHNAVD